MFEQAIDKDSNFALAYTGLADSSLRMYGETKETIWAQKATLSAQQAERLSNNLPEVHLSLGSVYSATGKYTQAVAELKRALELAPNSDEAYRNLGEAYIASGQSDQAIAAFQKAVAANPYYWSNHTSLGNAYFGLGDNAKALPEFQKVIEIAPDNPLGYENVGIGVSAARKVERGHSAISESAHARSRRGYVLQSGHRILLPEELRPGHEDVRKSGRQ